MQRTHKHGKILHPNVDYNGAMDTVFSMLVGIDEMTQTDRHKYVDKMKDQDLSHMSKCYVSRLC